MNWEGMCKNNGNKTDLRVLYGSALNLKFLLNNVYFILLSSEENRTSIFGFVADLMKQLAYYKY